LTIFGKDYDTPDGTCIRDFIHVVDLAKAHIAALKKMLNVDNGTYIYNLGSNKGVSVQELVDTFERVNNVKVNHKFAPRRKGDIATCLADPSKAEKELGFKATRTLEEMCKDAYNYAIKNK
jgi:UDP-glucose 4-epimerase